MIMDRLYIQTGRANVFPLIANKGVNNSVIPTVQVYTTFVLTWAHMNAYNSRVTYTTDIKLAKLTALDDPAIITYTTDIKLAKSTALDDPVIITYTTDIKLAKSTALDDPAVILEACSCKPLVTKLASILHTLL